MILVVLVRQHTKSRTVQGLDPHAKSRNKPRPSSVPDQKQIQNGMESLRVRGQVQLMVLAPVGGGTGGAFLPVR